MGAKRLTPSRGQAVHCLFTALPFRARAQLDSGFISPVITRSLLSLDGQLPLARWSALFGWMVSSLWLDGQLSLAGWSALFG